ncbi:MAG: phosphotransferase [Acidimicrobiales bacterium]
MHEDSLEGGITNVGAVVRAGEHVLRPASPYATSIHTFLRAIRVAGFDGAPMPIGIDSDRRERLEFIDGDVPTSPYPGWSQTDAALASIAKLLRRLHTGSLQFDPTGLEWSEDLADPAGGKLVCHNDVELSNIVFEDGVAIAFIDFEFAAPGRAIYDLAQFARLCVPLEADLDRARMGWQPADRPRRLRLIADEYGLDQAGRTALLAAIEDALDQIERLAKHNFELGEPAALTMLSKTGGLEKYDRRREWWQRHRDEFEMALD